MNNAIVINRAAARETAGDRVGALARRVGGNGTIALYAVAVIALIFGIEAVEGSDLAVTVVLTLGALYILYDGVIWSSAKPASPVTVPSTGSLAVRAARGDDLAAAATGPCDVEQRGTHDRLKR